MAQREGYSTVSPYVLAWGAPRLIEFARDVFGGEILMRQDREDGTVRHASVRIGDSVVMIADGSEQFPHFPIWLHIYVDDVDAVFGRALDHGGIAMDAPKDQADGDRRGAVRDPSGNIWWIASARG